jgi:tRNA (guanine10-N2)-dimethyltransferase
MYILELTKDYPELAKAEALALLKPKLSRDYENLLILDSKSDLYNRLAYTNAAYKVLFHCKPHEVEQKIALFPWKRYYEESFSVSKVGKSDFKQEELAIMVGKRIKNPTAKLKNAKTQVVFIFADKIYACLLVWENSKGFLKRKPHLRPELHPSSLNPKLARAMVNLSGTKKGILLDPFCGTGGILLEALLMGIMCRGSDIDEIMIKRCEKNLKSFKVACPLGVEDATKLNKRVSCIVADLPYAKNTKNVELDKMYKEFFKNIYDLTNTIVIGLPDFVSAKKVIGKWHIKEEFTYYLHKSLSKKIVVLEH